MPDKRIKILMLTTNSGVGGAQHVFYEHAKAFADFFEVTECYFSLDLGDSPNRQINNVISLGNSPSRGFFGKILSLIQRVRRVREIKKNGRYFTCISHMDGANWVNVLSGSPNGVKLISVIHGSLTRDKNRGKGIRKYFLNRIIVPFIYRRADVVVCVSDIIKQELDLLTQLPDLSISIPNYFDLDEINRLSNEPIEKEIDELFRNNKVLISVGRLAEEKNQKAQLRIFFEAKQKIPNCKLVIIGDGPMYDELYSDSIRYGFLTYGFKTGNPIDINYDVFFLGIKRNPYKYIKRSFVFLLTSFNEGFPLVLGESMCCGLPVISYDCTSGPKQILAPELSMNHKLNDIYTGPYGILIKEQGNKEITEKEVQTWMNAINKYFVDNNYYSAVEKRAYERITFFSKTNIINRWIRLIDTGN